MHELRPHSFKNNHKEIYMYVKKLPLTHLLKVKFKEMFPKPTAEENFLGDKRIKNTLGFRMSILYILVRWGLMKKLTNTTGTFRR